MRQRARGFVLVVALVASAVTPLAHAGAPTQESEEVEEADSLAEALRGGDAEISLRHRYEFVSDGAFDKDAHASTLRTTLSYRTLPFRGFELLIEAESVAVVGDDRLYNNGAGGETARVADRPVVADPAGTEINQAFLRFRWGSTTIALGRQRIALGDERHVGPVGWRQNHQSFDALTVVTRALPRLTLTYAFVGEVHRVVGDSKPMSTHLLDGTVGLGRCGIARFYGYFINFDRRVDKHLSTSTYGLEFAGSRRLGDDVALLYEVEYATQRSAADNPDRVDARYLLALGGVSYGDAVAVRAGWEVLGGGVETGQFNTPLATLHRFNGWADKFLSTPPDGLRDLQLNVSGIAGRLEWAVAYHDFDADTGGADYGRELDLRLLFRSPWGPAFGVKAALYDAEAFSADTRKLWAWTSYRF